MNRTEMVKERTNELHRMSDKKLVCTILSYFEKNATMPGEKAIKDNAASLMAMFEQNPEYELLTSFRNELIEEFASLCVKEVKLKNVQAMNETKKNADEDKPKASDLPMVLTDAKPVPVNTMKNIYSMNAVISETDGLVHVMLDYKTDFCLGTLPRGFKKNHRTIAGMNAVVVAADHSNGKFRNMSYSLLIDLGQDLAA